MVHSVPSAPPNFLISEVSCIKWHTAFLCSLVPFFAHPPLFISFVNTSRRSALRRRNKIHTKVYKSRVLFAQNVCLPPAAKTRRTLRAHEQVSNLLHALFCPCVCSGFLSARERELGADDDWVCYAQFKHPRWYTHAYIHAQRIQLFLNVFCSHGRRLKFLYAWFEANSFKFGFVIQESRMQNVGSLCCGARMSMSSKSKSVAVVSWEFFLFFHTILLGHEDNFLLMVSIGWSTVQWLKD